MAFCYDFSNESVVKSDVALHEVRLSYRNTPHKTIGHSPALLFFGRRLNFLNQKAHFSVIILQILLIKNIMASAGFYSVPWCVHFFFFFQKGLFVQKRFAC